MIQIRMEILQILAQEIILARESYGQISFAEFCGICGHLVDFALQRMKILPEILVRLI